MTTPNSSRKRLVGVVDGTAEPVRRSRGDRQREAIVNAVRELLKERSFEELSVSAISDRAGVARSGFYFYFESKYDVLALIFDGVTHELDELTHHFAPRAADETPEDFAKRMVGSAVLVYAHNDPVVSACNNARYTDEKIREMLDRQMTAVIDKLVKIFEDERDAGTAQPLSDDIPALVRTLGVTTALMLSGDKSFLGADEDLQRGIRILGHLWHAGLYGRRIPDR